MFKKILVCSDGSDCSLEAARMGASIAGRFGAEVVALHVFHIDSGSMGVWAIVLDNDSVDRSAREQRKAIEQSLRPLFEQAGAPFQMVQKIGHPVDFILALAEAEQVDLIIMGSHGLGGFERMLLGSVSERVVHHAHCPVLIVR